jgi:rRNA-processing protein FCF1
MKSVLLDTNFILSCLKKKIDFFDEIELMGIKIAIPEEVVKEIKKLSEEGNKTTQTEAKTALSFLNKNKFEKIKLETRNVDNGIVKFAKENKEIIIGTLDKGIKDRIQNQILGIRGDKGLEIK